MENQNPFNRLSPGQERELSQVRDIDVTGKLLPVGPNGQPVLMSLPDNPSRWVMLFSRTDLLRREMMRHGIRGYQIKEITDGSDFVRSVKEAGRRIALDPYVTGDRTRWTEIVEPGA